MFYLKFFIKYPLIAYIYGPILKLLHWNIQFIFKILQLIIQSTVYIIFLLQSNA